MRSDSEIDGRFLGYGEPVIVKCDAGIQTDNDPITDEAPEFAARPPPCKKKEMIPCMSVFKEVDKHALDVSSFSYILELYDQNKFQIYNNACNEVRSMQIMLLKLLLLIKFMKKN